MKIRFMCLIMLCVCIVFASCAEKSKSLPTSPVYVPSDNAENCSFAANLYSIKDNELVNNYTTIELISDLTPVEALIKILLAQKEMASKLPENISLTDAYISYNVCVVRFEGEFPDNIDKWLNLEAVIAPTLYDFCEVDTVCMLLNGSMPVYRGLPLGMAEYSSAGYTEYIRERRIIFNMLEDDPNYEKPISSTVVYFMPIPGSDYIGASTAEGSVFSPAYSKGMQVKELMRFYAKQFTKAYNFKNNFAFTECFTYKLNLEEELFDDLGIVGVDVNKTNTFNEDEQMLADCIALTLICNAPGIIQVDVYLGEYEHSCNFNAASKELGTNFYAYYPMKGENTLKKKEIIVKSEGRTDPQTVLEAFVSEENTSGTLFPNMQNQVTVGGISGKILMLSMEETVRDRIMQDFIEDDEYYDSPETRERLLVFSIVNTLTQLPVVEKVFFADEYGDALEPFLNINLSMPLYPNPGLESD